MKKRKTRKKKILHFADWIIVICVTVMLALTASVIWESHRLCTAIPADALRELRLFWGGELLIIALRQVLGSDIVDHFHPGSGSGPGSSI